MNLRTRRQWATPPAETLPNGTVVLRPRHGARVHLGCGERYLNGFLNIDLPPVAGIASGHGYPDVEADIANLSCPTSSLREIRLHHVFEHFERVEALALLIRWYEWLDWDGELLIEVPDFDSSIANFSERTDEEQFLILRHLFGSQEAPWARHLDGWSGSRLARVLQELGYATSDIERGTSDKRGLLVNVSVRASRSPEGIPAAARIERAASLLRLSMNGKDQTEERIYQRWETRLRELTIDLASQ